MLRLVASLNWLIGCLAVAVAVAYPFYYQAQVATAKTAASAAMDQIVQAERLKAFEPKGNVVYFRTNQQGIISGTLGVPLKDAAANFVYDAYSDKTHTLVLRAMTSDAAMRAGQAPLLYTYAVGDVSGFPKEGGHAEGSWERLSGQSVGLLALVGL